MARPYSREHTPKTARRLVLAADRVPATLFDAVRAKAKREGVSIRALILTLLYQWAVAQGKGIR